MEINQKYYEKIRFNLINLILLILSYNISQLFLKKSFLGNLKFENESEVLYKKTFHRK
jgi:hypothetical protein